MSGKALALSGLLAIFAPGAALAGATTYDLEVFLVQRDGFADRFWGLTPAPPARPAAQATGGDPYDFTIFLGQRDPFADLFWGIAQPTPGAPAARVTAPARITAP